LATKQNKTNKNYSDNATNELVFNSRALPDVMEQLSKYFNTRINYNKTEINEMNFTGTISKDDSLSIILKVIAQMNDLQISTSDSGYVIKKSNDAIKDDQ
jgi:ferric-dicitrate binding protein FerR (iron transport regulator)